MQGLFMKFILRAYAYRNYLNLYAMRLNLSTIYYRILNPYFNSVQSFFLYYYGIIVERILYSCTSTICYNL